jgi:hypothetical protein
LGRLVFTCITVFKTHSQNSYSVTSISLDERLWRRSALSCPGFGNDDSDIIRAELVNTSSKTVAVLRFSKPNVVMDTGVAYGTANAFVLKGVILLFKALFGVVLTTSLLQYLLEANNCVFPVVFLDIVERART